jgi:hypothetical protein
VFGHQEALNQLASNAAIALADARCRGQTSLAFLELGYEELLGITGLAPPAILSFGPMLGLIEQDDLHDGPGTTLRELPRVHAASGLRILERALEGGVQRGTFSGRQLILDNKDLAFSAVRQIRGLVEIPVGHSSPESFAPG